MEVKPGDIFYERIGGSIYFYQILTIKGSIATVKAIEKTYIWIKDGFPRTGEVDPLRDRFVSPRPPVRRKVLKHEDGGETYYSFRTQLGGCALQWDGNPVQTWGF
jgi:hypothetical protein